MAEIPGGCLCCVNGLPFQVGLARLLRKARPDRLLIEPSGLGHPAELLRQLRQPPWQRVLAVQPSVLVLDAAALHRGERCPTASGKPLPDAGLMLLNKSEGLDDPAARRWSASYRSARCTGRPRASCQSIDCQASAHAPANPGNRSACRMGRLR